MFFGNKKSEMGGADTLKKEVVAQEEKEETFVISDYAMERYKKSKHYNKTGLTNEEIEILFCDKQNWNSIKEYTFEKFNKALEKICCSYEYVVFPSSTFIFQDTSFDECIFYNTTIQGEANLTFSTSYFYYCSINAKETIRFKNIIFDLTTKITSCKNLNVTSSKIDLDIPSDFELDFINEIVISKSNINNLIVNPNINKLEIIDSEFNNKDTSFEISSDNINLIKMENVNLTKVASYAIKLSSVVEKIFIDSCAFSSFFDLSKKQYIHISKSTIKDKMSWYAENNNLRMYIFESTLGSLHMGASSIISIGNSTVYNIRISDSKTLILYDNIIQNLDISGETESIEVSNSKIESYCSLASLKNKDMCVLKNNTFNKGVDFKFSSINKLAIYKSNFKELDFDCSFINEAKFVQVKGLNEENETEELSEKHFASKDSFKFFEKVTKE